MRSVILGFPTLAFVVVTRAALAAGVGLLVSGKLPPARRRAIGTTLVAVGAMSTIPAAISVVRGIVRTGDRGYATVRQDKRLIGATRFARKGDDDI